jgi:hypothetical protein
MAYVQILSGVFHRMIKVIFGSVQKTGLTVLMGMNLNPISSIKKINIQSVIILFMLSVNTIIKIIG